MSGDDLIVAAPWLVFGAGLALIGWRLLVGRRRTRRGAVRPRAAEPVPHRGRGTGRRDRDTVRDMRECCGQDHNHEQISRECSAAPGDDTARRRGAPAAGRLARRPGNRELP
jgi:hypothetical protein